MDGQCDTNLSDARLFRTEPDTAQDDPGCVAAMLDSDADIDLDDYGLFEACLSGPDAFGDPACTE